jgi:hypothetical protein
MLIILEAFYLQICSVSDRAGMPVGYEMVGNCNTVGAVYIYACLILQYCRIEKERRHCAQVWCYLSLLFPLKSDIQWNDTIVRAIWDPGREFKGFLDRSTSMLTRLWNGWQNIRASILARGVELFIPPNLSYLSPPASYAMVRGDNLWRFESGRCMQLSFQLQLVPRLRVSGAAPPFPHMPSWCDA